MKVPIDKAGRIVVPKELRKRLGVDGGEELEVFEADGHIEIHRPQRQTHLTKSPGGNLTITPGTGTSAEEIRILIERSRERHA